MLRKSDEQDLFARVASTYDALATLQQRQHNDPELKISFGNYWEEIRESEFAFQNSAW